MNKKEKDIVDNKNFRDEQWIAHLESRIKALNMSINMRIMDSDVSIDFNKIGAVSIERGFSDSAFATIVRYWGGSESGKIEAWKTVCSQETHERLVKEFDEYKKSSISQPVVEG